MKSAQNAPNFIPFKKNSGGACPRTPLAYSGRFASLTISTRVVPVYTNSVRSIPIHFHVDLVSTGPPFLVSYTGIYIYVMIDSKYI